MIYREILLPPDFFQFIEGNIELQTLLEKFVGETSLLISSYMFYSADFTPANSIANAACNKRRKDIYIKIRDMILQKYPTLKAGYIAEWLSSTCLYNAFKSGVQTEFLNYFHLPVLPFSAPTP